MGFEIYPRQSVPRTRNRKILVCEREVKKVHFTIVDDTEIRMTAVELDTGAQGIHDEIRENTHLMTHQICKKVIMERTEAYCVANANSLNDWTIRISDPLKFVCWRATKSRDTCKAQVFRFFFYIWHLK